MATLSALIKPLNGALKNAACVPAAFEQALHPGVPPYFLSLSSVMALCTRFFLEAALSAPMMKTGHRSEELAPNFDHQTLLMLLETAYNGIIGGPS